MIKLKAGRGVGFGVCPPGEDGDVLTDTRVEVSQPGDIEDPPGPSTTKALQQSRHFS